MLVVLIIILVLIWAAVVWSIYSNFIVFYSNFSESENYHKAYYASISALERWELVTKQRSPGYVWSGWFILWQSSWSANNTYLSTDNNLSSFSYLWDNLDISTVFRSVDSRTSRIPKSWMWNVEYTFRSSDSKDYNAMDYDNSEIFLLYYDRSQYSPYKKTVCTTDSSTPCIRSSPSSINWKIRLPKHLIDSWGFLSLDTNYPLIWLYNEMPGDDTIIDRQIRWTYDNNTYTIFSTQKFHSGRKIDYTNDSIFRESDFNNPSNYTLSFNFWNNWNPFTSNHGWHSASHVQPTIISPKENDIKSDHKFSEVLRKSKKNQIRFNLLNLVKDIDWKIYPFLEYYINFWTGVSDKYFTIKWEWAFSDFEVNTIIQKPTVKESVLWDFTSIF